MQEQGIVRRVDELGRLVIPKELRKTLRIKEGDPLEIYARQNELVLKKYSPINSFKNLSSAVADGIEQILDKACIITDCDSVICVSNGRCKDLLGKNISNELDRVLKERKSLLLSRVEGSSIISVVLEDNTQAENQIIVPIVNAGDCYGAIIVFDKDKTNRFSSFDLKLIQLGSSFLSSQLD